MLCEASWNSVVYVGVVRVESEVYDLSFCNFVMVSYLALQQFTVNYCILVALITDVTRLRTVFPLEPYKQNPSSVE